MRYSLARIHLLHLGVEFKARFTKFKYIYLTGHLMFWIALVLTAVQLEIDPNASTLKMVVVGSVIIAVYWVLQPAVMQPLMRKVTGGEELALGYTSASGDWLAGKLAPFVGKPEQSTEDHTLPVWLGFFRNVTVATVFVIAIVVIIICMVIFGAIGWAVIVPPMIMVFFVGGTAGIFGNATGGVRGAILGGVIIGLFLAFGQAITMPMLSTTSPELAQLADPNWYLIIWIFKPILSLIYGLFYAPICCSGVGDQSVVWIKIHTTDF